MSVALGTVCETEPRLEHEEQRSGVKSQAARECHRGLLPLRQAGPRIPAPGLGEMYPRH